MMPGNVRNQIMDGIAPRSWLVGSLIGLLFGAVAARGETAAQWRVFATADGLYDAFVTHVSVGPFGNVLAKHGEFDPISLLTGYSVTNIVGPGGRHFGVYQNRTRQLWSMYQGGISEYDGKGWVQRPVNQIRDEFRTNLLRQVRANRLVPAERDHVLFLLSSQLGEYDATLDAVTVLRESVRSVLGPFVDMIEARDGGIWLSAEGGLAKLPGPVRRLTPETMWEEYPVPESLNVRFLQRPIEDDSGGVTVIATSRDASERRVIVHFRNGQWSRLEVPGQKVKFAWRGANGVFWVATLNGLMRMSQEVGIPVSTESIGAGQLFDAAVEPGGRFWLATLDGLVRHAPLTWQRVSGVERLESPFHSILEHPNGRLWFAGSAGLVAVDDDGARIHTWPDGFDPIFRPTDAIYRMNDGRLIVSARDRPLLFDPGASRFAEFPVPPGFLVRNAIGQFHDGRAALWTASVDRPDSPLVHAFDGSDFFPITNSDGLAGVGGELYFLHEFDPGDIWIGGNEGLGTLRDRSLHAFDESEGFIGGRVLCLLELPDGRIWCGTVGGVLEYDGRKWSVIRQGLGRVNAMFNARRDGSVWLATSAGLFRHGSGSWVSNDTMDGLPSSVVYDAWEDSRNRLWAATTLGLGRYHPRADVDPPIATIEPVSPGDSRTDEPVELLVRGRDQWDYTTPARLLFSYRLDNGQWTAYSPMNRLVFQDLPAGKHRLELRAMDRNWNRQEDPAVHEFLLRVPWFQESRLIAVSLAGLVVAVSLAALAVNRHRRLLKSYAEVEGIVAQRTRELERANQALLHSQKMKALGTLAAGVAHDFNSILSIIKGSAQIIEAHPGDSDRVRTRVARIMTVVDQGSSLVRAMLGISRVRNEGVSDCDVNVLVERTLRLVEDRFLPGIVFRHHPAPELPALRAPADLVRQILLNLIINAGDALGGKGLIELTTFVIDDAPADAVLQPRRAPPYVGIAVKDNGIGIDPEVLPRIFEPFFTTKSFSSRRGTGLGLSMVYELAKEMEYGISVESAPGKGSSFTLLIAAGPAPETDDSREGQSPDESRRES